MTNSSTPRRKLHLVQSNSSQRKAKNSLVCRSHRILGDIYRSKGEREKAVHHFEAALGIASPFNWHDRYFGIITPGGLFCDEEKVRRCTGNHIEQAKSHAAEDGSNLGLAMEMQARIWYRQSQARRGEIRGSPRKGDL
jgi:tetratricopeptide (TPR) repeat protein